MATTTPAQLASGRRQRRVGIAVVGATFLAVFGPGIVATLRGGAAAPSGWQDRVAVAEWDVLAVLVALVSMRYVVRHLPDVAQRLSLQPASPAVTLTGAALFVAAALASTRLVEHVVASPSTAGLGTGAGALTTGVLAGWSAAVTEELVLIALAAAVTRGPAARVVVVLVALRWLVHLYYLGASVFVLLWVPAAYVIYRWTRSIWPLVLGHGVYDTLAVLGSTYTPLRPATDLVLFVVALAGVLALAVESGDRSAKCSRHAVRRDQKAPADLDVPNSMMGPAGVGGDHGDSSAG